MEFAEQAQQRTGFTPFESNTVTESDRDSNYIRSAPIQTPLGSLEVIASQAIDPKYMYNPETPGIYINEQGDIISQDAIELAAKGLYTVWTITEEKPAVGPNTVNERLQAHLWLPDSKFELSADLEYPEEIHEEDEHIIADFSHKFTTDEQGNRVQVDIPFFTEEQLKRLKFSISSKSEGGEV